MPRHIIFSAVFVLLTGIAAIEASELDFDDIEFWAGEGPNRAALVFDWWEAEGEGFSTVWGYRWDGAASSYDMLHDVVVADERLYAKLGGKVLLFGVGYDEPGDTPFAVTDGTQFDDDGIAVVAETLGAESVDPADRYADDWEDGYWVHAVADESPYAGGAWTRTNDSLASRGLTDGTWDGWTFTDKVERDQLMLPIFPDLPTPATTPNVGGPAGDYTGDGIVDLADFTKWRDELGATAVPAGSGADGTGDGVVDASDYGWWKQHYGASVFSAAITYDAAIPEPAAAWLLMASCTGYILIRFNFWRA